MLTCYGTLNYQLDKGYTVGGKDVVICGGEAPCWTEIYANTISEGSFPRTENEVIVTGNMKKELDLSIGSTISIRDADGMEYPYIVSGFSENPSMIMRKDIYGVFMNTAAFRDLYPGVTDGEPDDYDSCFFVQFHSHHNIRKTINDIKTQFHLSDDQVGEQAMLLGLLGQSDTGNTFMLMIYASAAVLSVLVLLAGILMIASSLNSNIAGRNAALYWRDAKADHTAGSQGGLKSVHLCHTRQHPCRYGCHMDIVCHFTLSQPCVFRHHACLCGESAKHCRRRCHRYPDSVTGVARPGKTCLQVVPIGGCDRQC